MEVEVPEEQMGLMLCCQFHEPSAPPGAAPNPSRGIHPNARQGLHLRVSVASAWLRAVVNYCCTDE